jgi:uncharacterized protein (DUF1015 family)
MAALRPFRGLRYTPNAGALDSLVSPATRSLTPQQRDEYVNHNAFNVVGVASPEGHGDDRSKYIRYARAAARLAEWRREGYLVAQEHPSFYRITHRTGLTPEGDSRVHTTLLAVADLSDGLVPVEASDPKLREERLRLLEATRTVFEPTVAYYNDPQGTGLEAIRRAKVSSAASLGAALVETIDDPDDVEAIAVAFRGKTLLMADGVEGYEAARAFRESLGQRSDRVPEDGTLVAISSLDDPTTVRTAVHRVIRRLPGGIGREELLALLANRFSIEPHHNRNLEALIDRGETAFGLATEGGLGYLLKPLESIDAPAAIWLQHNIIEGLLGVAPNDSLLFVSDAIHAARAVDEGAAAAFLLPRPLRSDISEAPRLGLTLPDRSSAAYPGFPTGLVMWAMGDDI